MELKIVKSKMTMHYIETITSGTVLDNCFIIIQKARTVISILQTKKPRFNYINLITVYKNKDSNMLLL